MGRGLLETTTGQNSHLKKKILGSSQLHLVVSLGSCRLPTHTPGKKQLESHLVLWRRPVGWALSC